MLSWKFWTRFAPLVLLLVALRWPLLALAGLGATLAGALWLFRIVDAPLEDKLMAWLVFSWENLGWSAGFIVELVRFAVKSVTGSRDDATDQGAG
jgi:hypothetical protein